MMSFSDTHMDIDALPGRILRILSSILPLRIKLTLLLNLYPEWPPQSIPLQLVWRLRIITQINIKLNMSRHMPAREALRDMEIAVPPGQDLPPQQLPDPYAQRPRPPIPPRSSARGSMQASLSLQQGPPPPAPLLRSPARVSTSRPLAPPPEYWKLPATGLTYSNKPLPPPIITGSRVSHDHSRFDLPEPEAPFIREKLCSVRGTKTGADLVPHPTAPRSPSITPTLHNSPDKIRQMIGHDVNISSDMGQSRVQSETYDSATYTASASRRSSSCDSNGTIETTMSEPVPPALASEVQQVTEYDDDLERMLVAECFDFNPSPKSLPDSPLSAHVDPLIIKRRAEVMSGEIRLSPAIQGLPRPLERPVSFESRDSRRASASGATPKRTKGREDYVVRDLYHATTAHIAASTKRRETQEYAPSPPPKSTPRMPVSQAVSRLGLSPKRLTRQRRTSQLAGLPFSASAFEVGDRPLRTPHQASPPTSTFETDDEKRSYMPSIFREDTHAGARAKLQDLVSHARRSAGFLTKPERRRASLRHKIRVIPEKDGA
ncbi:hypothetical protein VUR80DRAFT_1032 [Thermomyces stellatus]